MVKCTEAAVAAAAGTPARAASAAARPPPLPAPSPSTRYMWPSTSSSTTTRPPTRRPGASGRPRRRPQGVSMPHRRRRRCLGCTESARPRRPPPVGGRAPSTVNPHPAEACVLYVKGSRPLPRKVLQCGRPPARAQAALVRSLLPGQFLEQASLQRLSSILINGVHSARRNARE